MEENVPKKIRLAADSVVQSLLPLKSGDNYVKTYERFMAWKERENIEKENFSETVVLAYFSFLKNTYKPSSLWVIYSMLKTVIEQRDNVNINYPKLNSFLKRGSIGFVQKKSNVFQPEDIARFICEAPDNEFLFVKVSLIFGVYGATRGDELAKVCVEHVKQHGDVLVIKVPETKTNVVRSFTLEGEYACIVRKYMSLRPINAPTNRFFLNYQKGKCTVQVVGRNKFLQSPKVVATFLNLEDASAYTGHSFRRTSATLLADSGADMLTLKRHGGWRSGSVVEGYIAESIENKRKIGGLISNRIASTSTVTSTIVQSQSTVVEVGDNENVSSIEITQVQENRDDVQPVAQIPSISNVSPTTNIVSIPTTSVGNNVVAVPSMVMQPNGSFEERKHCMNFHNCTVKITNK